MQRGLSRATLLRTFDCFCTGALQANHPHRRLRWDQPSRQRFDGGRCGRFPIDSMHRISTVFSSNSVSHGETRKARLSHHRGE